MTLRPKRGDVARGQIRTAIIDIGSNSVRLVAYAGARRAPAIVFNEKVMAGLGRSLAKNGRIDDQAFARGLYALDRFATLCRAMQIDNVECVATAAVREATNGPDFVREARQIGLTVRLLSGTDEAEASGLGVISAIPEADGIVADLGGGSLELVRVKDGKTLHRSSFPLGVLRIAPIRAKGAKSLEQRFRAALKAEGWGKREIGLPIYLVGGSWRSLAKLDMALSEDSLPVMHHHQIPVPSAMRLPRVLAHLSAGRLDAVRGISFSRTPYLADAAALLTVMARRLEPSALIVSSSGLREGLLYQALPSAVRRHDPLIAAVEAEGEKFSRFSANGRPLDRWIAPLFEHESAGAHRLRLAACLLADVAWLATPGFRAEHGLEAALHGNWTGIDMTGRVVMGQALHTCYGGGARPFKGIAARADPDDVAQAIGWGLAMRLGLRLSGGIPGPLTKSNLAIRRGRIELTLPRNLAGLDGETVARRLKQLAEHLRFGYAIITE